MKICYIQLINKLFFQSKCIQRYYDKNTKRSSH